MSWRIAFLRDPTNFLINSPIYQGLGDDRGKYLYRDALAAGDWVRSPFLGAQILVDGDRTVHPWLVYNGLPFFTCGSRYLWWDGSGWIISSRLGGCTGELWDDSLDTPAYTGDQWHSGGGSISGRYEARGSLRGETEGEFEGDAKNVTVEHSGAKHTGDGGEAPWGLYLEWDYETTVDDAGGVVEEETDGSAEYYAGLPKWTDDDREEYVRNLSGSRYGKAHHDGSGWVIGRRDSESGWYEGEEPSLDFAVTFSAKKTETGTYPGDSSAPRTLSFDEYVKGDEVYAMYSAEVGLWL